MTDPKARLKALIFPKNIRIFPHEISLKKHICAAVVNGYGNFSKVGENNVHTFAVIVIALSFSSKRYLRKRKFLSIASYKRDRGIVGRAITFWGAIEKSPLLLT